MNTVYMVVGFSVGAEVSSIRLFDSIEEAKQYQRSGKCGKELGYRGNTVGEGVIYKIRPGKSPEYVGLPVVTWKKHVVVA